MDYVIIGKNSYVSKFLILFLKEKKKVKDNIYLFSLRSIDYRYLEKKNKKTFFLISFINKKDKKSNIKNIENYNKLFSKINFNNSKVLFFSSTKIYTSGFYSDAKRTIYKSLKELQKVQKFKLINLIIPNIYGPSIKINHNSFIATLCKNIISGNQIEYNDSKLNLIYINDLIDIILNILNKNISFNVKFQNINTSKISEIEKIFLRFKFNLKNNTLPSVQNSFESNLFIMYISYLNKPIFKIKNHFKDKRGLLFEIFKFNNLGQLFFSETNFGFFRGNHYHTDKYELFIPINGNISILEKNLINTDASIKKYTVKSDNEIYISRPYVAHNMCNKSKIKKLKVLFWVNKFFNKNDQDTIGYKLV